MLQLCILDCTKGRIWWQIAFSLWIVLYILIPFSSERLLWNYNAVFFSAETWELVSLEKDDWTNRLSLAAGNELHGIFGRRGDLLDDGGLHKGGGRRRKVIVVDRQNRQVGRRQFRTLKHLIMPINVETKSKLRNLETWICAIFLENTGIFALLCIN